MFCGELCFSLSIPCWIMLHVLNEVARYECLKGQCPQGLPSLPGAWLTHPCHHFLLSQLLADLFVFAFCSCSCSRMSSSSVLTTSESFVFLQCRVIRPKQTVCVSVLAFVKYSLLMSVSGYRNPINIL